MAKVLIPASGGVNSAFSLHQFLSETDHEIIAVHFTEEYFNVDERQDFITVSDWLIENVRSFERHYVRLPKVERDERPIRAGFKNMCSYSEIDSRYAEFVTQIRKHTVDAVVSGYSVENTSTDRIPLMLYDTWQSEEGVKVFLSSISITEAISFENNIDILAAQMSGRFEQFEALPAALQPLIKSCDLTTCTDAWCLRCAYQRGYEKFLADGKTGRDFDQWCAKKGSYGAWRSEANPEEYTWRGTYCDEYAVRNYLADLVGRDWPSDINPFRYEIDTGSRIAWFAENGVDMSGIETEQQLGDFCGRLGRINLDRGIDSDAMRTDEYWAAILAAAKEV